MPSSIPRDDLHIFVASCNIGACDYDTTFVFKISGMESYDAPSRLRVHIADVTPEGLPRWSLLNRNRSRCSHRRYRGCLDPVDRSGRGTTSTSGPGDGFHETRDTRHETRDTRHIR
ncbi:MAG: hypothetical protein ACYCST_09170 [Acidimicrobiales bacterium]